MQSVLAQHKSLAEHLSTSEQTSLSYQIEYLSGNLESNFSFFYGGIVSLSCAGVDEVDVEDPEFNTVYGQYGLVGPTPELGVGLHVQPTGQS